MLRRRLWKRGVPQKGAFLLPDIIIHIFVFLISASGREGGGCARQGQTADVGFIVLFHWHPAASSRVPRWPAAYVWQGQWGQPSQTFSKQQNGVGELAGGLLHDGGDVVDLEHGRFHFISEPEQGFHTWKKSLSLLSLLISKSCPKSITNLKKPSNLSENSHNHTTPTSFLWAKLLFFPKLIMGNKNSTAELSQEDLDLFATQTGWSVEDIKGFYEEFVKNAPGGKIPKEVFLNSFQVCYLMLLYIQCETVL